MRDGYNYPPCVIWRLKMNIQLIIGIACEVVAFIGMVILIKTAPAVWGDKKEKND